ncbi:hypothetical protein [Henriciella litoralis]|uniref:hypothetical protein n=1 Tax=Henriciella litoralis TaxID=568102 RepID=UPI000A0344D8|nr:hypothetical protein [Henriciella litoralis]
MPEFGPNGVVIDNKPSEPAAYADQERPKIRRVLLATLLCGVAASIIVALIGAVVAVSVNMVSSILGVSTVGFSSRDGFMAGGFLAVMMACFNWFVFYIVIPVTWLVLAFSIGRFPGRGISRHVVYYRWGAIWGGVLVSLPTGFFGLTMGGSAFWGAVLTGGAIGATSGLICAALFLAVVRPRQQMTDNVTDVF